MSYVRKKVLAEGVELYLGDCLEVLPTLERHDAVISDPPYGVDFAAWDGSIPDWLPLARAIATTVAFTTGPTTCWAYPVPDWLGAWVRPGSPARTAQGGFNHWTPILIWGAKFQTDMIYLPPVANLSKREYPPGFGHPSPKPLELMRWMIEQSSVAGEWILDPFMGSGTTGVAAVKLGRKFTGIELDPGYFDIACQRISAALREPDLFIAHPKPAEQLSILDGAL